MGRSDWLIVGVSGATCSGKTTLSASLSEAFPGSVVLHQDDYFLDVADERQTPVPELNHLNFEILSSLDNDGFLAKIMSVVDGPAHPGLTYGYLLANFGSRIPSSYATGRHIRNLLILDGFLLYDEPRVAALCDVKFFITLDEDTCLARRSVRTYEPPDPPGYFQLCVWPCYVKHLKEVRSNVPDAIYMEGTVVKEDLMEQALNAILPVICTVNR